MRAAIIENGVVANIIEADNLGVFPGLIDAIGADIGDLWDGSTFTKPPAPPPVVPQSVSRFQALAALSNAGLLTQAQNAVNASPNPLVPLAWNNAQTFDRNSSTVATLGPALGLTDAQIDSLFIAASTITA
jgi:hypothetical protein